MQDLEVRGRVPGFLVPPPVSWADSPPSGGLVVMSRYNHLQSDVKVTVTITDIAQESLGQYFLSFRKVPSRLYAVPAPAILAEEGFSSETLS